MFGKILYISDNIAHVENKMNRDVVADLMNVHVVFEAPNQRILGEVIELNDEIIKIRFLGEYQGNRYLNGVLRKPLLSSTIRVINGQELLLLVGNYNEKSFILGDSAIYKNIQNVFSNQAMNPINANLFFFDAYGEYKNAFGNLNTINPNYNYKFITTNPHDPSDFMLDIPLHLLNLDDWALLLQASKHSQLPIIENTIKLAKIFSQDNETSRNLKNHLIAKALLAVLFSNETMKYLP